MNKDRKILAYYALYKAGMTLLKILEKGGRISRKEKGNLDFVSMADKKAEEIIISEIQKHFPKDDILSEESSELNRGAAVYRWIIDPLDGTHNYLAGLKEWGILLAIERKGDVMWGVCYFPALKEVFEAEKGIGAFLNYKKIEVSKTADLRGKMFCSDGIIRKKPKEILGDIEKFCKEGCRLRVYGSSPYAFTRVALGQAIVATNRVGKPWDIAAPALLVEEAGGKITDGSGNPWSVDSKNLIATNGLVHEEALKIFAR